MDLGTSPSPHRCGSQPLHVHPAPHTGGENGGHSMRRCLLTMRGTGNALVTECCNTCLLSEDEGRYLLVDGRGGEAPEGRGADRQDQVPPPRASPPATSRTGSCPHRARRCVPSRRPPARSRRRRGSRPILADTSYAGVRSTFAPLPPTWVQAPTAANPNLPLGSGRYLQCVPAFVCARGCFPVVL